MQSRHLRNRATMKMKKKFKIFQWYEDVYAELNTCFTFGDESLLEGALELFIETVRKEMHDILKAQDMERSECLLCLVKDTILYLHVQNIFSRRGYEVVQYLYLKLLSCLIDLCILLSHCLPESADHYLSMACQDLVLFTGNSIPSMWDALLECSLLKKKTAEVCRPILKRIMSLPADRNLEPKQYMKFLLLCRLWKVFTCDRSEKSEIVSMACRIEVPPNFAEFLSLFPLTEISSICGRVKNEKMAKYFICKKFPPNILRDAKQILCDETCRNVSQVRVPSPSLAISAEGTGGAGEILFYMDVGPIEDEDEVSDKYVEHGQHSDFALSGACGSEEKLTVNINDLLSSTSKQVLSAVQESISPEMPEKIKCLLDKRKQLCMEEGVEESNNISTNGQDSVDTGFGSETPPEQNRASIRHDNSCAEFDIISKQPEAAMDIDHEHDDQQMEVDDGKVSETAVADETEDATLARNATESETENPAVKSLSAEAVNLCEMWMEDCKAVTVSEEPASSVNEVLENALAKSDAFTNRDKEGASEVIVVPSLSPVPKADKADIPVSIKPTILCGPLLLSSSCTEADQNSVSTVHPAQDSPAADTDEQLRSSECSKPVDCLNNSEHCAEELDSNPEHSDCEVEIDEAKKKELLPSETENMEPESLFNCQKASDLLVPKLNLSIPAEGGIQYSEPLPTSQKIGDSLVPKFSSCIPVEDVESAANVDGTSNKTSPTKCNSISNTTTTSSEVENMHVHDYTNDSLDNRSNTEEGSYGSHLPSDRNLLVNKVVSPNKTTISSVKKKSSSENDLCECRYVKCLYPGQRLPSNKTQALGKNYLSDSSCSDRIHPKMTVSKSASLSSLSFIKSPSCSLKLLKASLERGLAGNLQNPSKKLHSISMDDLVVDYKEVKNEDCLQKPVTRSHKDRSLSVSPNNSVNCLELSKELRCPLPQSVEAGNLKKADPSSPIRQEDRKSGSDFETVQSPKDFQSHEFVTVLISHSDSEFHSPALSDCNRNEVDGDASAAQKCLDDPCPPVANGKEGRCVEVPSSGSSPVHVTPEDTAAKDDSDDEGSISDQKRTVESSTEDSRPAEDVESSEEKPVKRLASQMTVEEVCIDDDSSSSSVSSETEDDDFNGSPQSSQHKKNDISSSPVLSQHKRKRVRCLSSDTEEENLEKPGPQQTSQKKTLATKCSQHTPQKKSLLAEPPQVTPQKKGSTSLRTSPRRCNGYNLRTRSKAKK